MAQIKIEGAMVDLEGREVKTGDQAPDFVLRRGTTPDTAYTLATDAGKVRILSAMLSLDTSVCDKQARTFHEKSRTLSKDIVVVNITADLPITQQRWAGSAGLEGPVLTASDYFDGSFGRTYGIRVKDQGTLARAVFVLDRKGHVVYKEIVLDLGKEPQYDKAIAAAKNALA